MYAYIKGEVVEITPKQIIIDNNGIGYNINVSNPYSFELNKVKIYVYQHVKEDELTLYGFKNEDEKNLFLDLISVKGIGPRTALVILAATDINSFKIAIKNKDINYLSKFPKVGKKSAQQIILDLEKKYDDTIIEDNSVNNSNDLIEALTALGYNIKIINKIIPQLDLEQSLENQIKAALKLLLK